MSSIPANAQGLAGNKRVMVTQYNGTCDYCGRDTIAGVDFFAYAHDGGKVSACAGCAISVPAMILGVCQRIGKVQDLLTEEQLAALDMPAGYAEAIGGQLTPAETQRVLVEIQAVWTAVDAFTRQDDARIVALRHVVPNGSFEQSFIPSVLDQYARKGDLSPKQWGIVEKALAKRAATDDGKPEARTGRPNRYGGKCVNCEFYVPAGQGLYSNGVCSHTVCPTFEEWCLDTWGALPGSPELREIAVRHANLTHNCMFCNTELDHPDSDPRKGGVGYGPICAAKYGLPHGGSTKRAKGQTLGKETADMDALADRVDGTY